MDIGTLKELLSKYNNNLATDEEKMLVDVWYELIPDPNPAALSPAETDDIQAELWGAIQKRANTRSTQSRRLYTKWWMAAAVFIGIFIAFYFWDVKKDSIFTKVDANAITSITNNKAIPERCLLPDGSIVLLQPKASISYPKTFSVHQRAVDLTGEGSFEVVRNEDVPFVVYQEGVATQVLGTSFTVKPAKELNQIKVIVRTGKVAVYISKPQIDKRNKPAPLNEILVTPNQQAVVNTSTKNITSSIIDNPVMLVSEKEENRLATFNETTLDIVIINLKKTYGIDVMLENATHSQCRFTGDISKLSFYQKLQLITRSTNLQYKQENTKIILFGKGCN